MASTSGQEYVFQPNNPFLSDPESAEKGKQLFRHGLLSEAVLAFEAEVGFWVSHSFQVAFMIADAKGLFLVLIELKQSSQTKRRATCCIVFACVLPRTDKGFVALVRLPWLMLLNA